MHCIGGLSSMIDAGNCAQIEPVLMMSSAEDLCTAIWPDRVHCTVGFVAPMQENNCVYK